MQHRYHIAREAIRTRNYGVLNRILSAGLNPDIPAMDGRYLVHDAVIFDADGPAIEILARFGANLNARWATYLSWTPVHLAAFKERQDVLLRLKTLGADFSLKDSRGWMVTKAPAPCPITRIEAKQKLSPMALLVQHSSKIPVFA